MKDPFLLKVLFINPDGGLVVLSIYYLLFYMIFLISLSFSALLDLIELVL